jgi:hypothetical protein
VGRSAAAVILGATVLLDVGSRYGGRPAPLTGLRQTDETPSAAAHPIHAICGKIE